jgi:predicted PurR-regulated permease PerM
MAARTGSTGTEPTRTAGTPAPARFGIAWSDQSVRLLVLAIGVVAVLWLARGIIGPFVVAAVLAYAFSPVVSVVENRTRLPRVVVVGLGYLLLLGAVGILAYVAAERAGKELVELSSGGRDVVSSALHKLLGNSVVVAGTTYNVNDLAQQIRQAFLGYVNSPSSAVQVAERAVDIGLQVILCLIITFYLLLDGHRFGQFALRFLDRGQRVETLRIAHRIHVVLGRWLRGQLLLIFLVAVVFYVILGPILHIPFALALAILSGVLEIIPLVGPIIAAALAGTVTFATHGTNTTIVVLVVYFVVRQIEDQVVMPLVIGRAVHLHPVITIFAVLVGLSTFGVLGGLLGVPVAAAINVTLHELYPEETGGHAKWEAEVKKALVAEVAAGGGGEDVAAGEEAAVIGEIGGGAPAADVAVDAAPAAAAPAAEAAAAGAPATRDRGRRK